MKKMLLLFLTLTMSCTVMFGCGGTASAVPTGPNVVKMVNTGFSPTQISIHKGERITFAEDADHQALHILILGDHLQAKNEPGAPDFGGLAGIRIDVGNFWTSPPWNTVGTFQVACSIHPLMNLTVIVS